MTPNRGTIDAEAVAIRALHRLTAEPERLARFLSMTGLGPDTIRAAAGSPGFLAAVLDHVGSNEDLLVEIAAEANLDPGDFALARARLSPDQTLE